MQELRNIFILVYLFIGPSLFAQTSHPKKGFNFLNADEEIDPHHGVVDLPGLMLSTGNFDGKKLNAIGIPIIGIAGTLGYAIKEKYYMGVYLGIQQLGITVRNDPDNPNTSSYQSTAILKLPIGFSFGYVINEDAFVSLRYFFCAQSSPLLNTAADDGWAFGTTLRYQNIMLDLVKSQKDNTGGGGSGFWKSRMRFDHFAVSAKYLFKIKNFRKVFVGLGYEHFVGDKTFLSPIKVSNKTLTLGHIF